MEKLHPKTIEMVRQRADIVEVVGDKVVLRKSGRDFKGLCPFHDDKSPSFYVSASKGIYKCFSCGAAGDVFKFVAEINKVPFAEAALELAQRYQVPVHTLHPEKKAEFARQLSRQQQLLEILQQAAEFYSYALHSKPGRPALEYLQQRNISAETIQQFQLGYAPQGWQGLYSYLVEQKRYPVQLVAECGLIRSRNNGAGWYDYFRHRVMVPICNDRGQVVAFGGRSLGEEQPKYLNSPETELFSKGRTLYALHLSKDGISRKDQAVVVEGYFDAIALHQAGIKNVVASLGTALTQDQVKLLLRYTASNRVILNFDGDVAGNKATHRALESVKSLAASMAVQFRILVVPDGKDPDEFLRHHSPAEYEALVNQAKPLLDWLLDQAFAGKNLRLPEHFKACSEQVVTLLSELTDNLSRAQYLQHMADRLAEGNGRLAIQLEEELRRRIRALRWGGNKPQKSKSGINQSLGGMKLQQAEFQLLQIFLNYPEYRADIFRGLEERTLEFSISHHRTLWQIILELQEELEVDADLLLALRGRCDDPKLNGQLTELLWISELGRVALMRPSMVVRAALANMELEICQRSYRQWVRYWEDCLDPEQARFYQEEMHEEYQRIKELEIQTYLSYEEMAALADDTPVLDDELGDEEIAF
jgi:DNA primase